MSEEIIEFEHGCWQHVNTTDRIVTTGFPDGSRLLAACPLTTDEEAVARAVSLGYLNERHSKIKPVAYGALWQMTKDHDRLHMVLAQARGLMWSPVLYAVATGTSMPDDPEDEERIVFAATRLMNLGREGMTSP